MDSTFVTRLITPGGRSSTTSANSSRVTSPQSTARSRKLSRGNSKQSQRLLAEILINGVRDEDDPNKSNVEDATGREGGEEKVPETEEDIAREVRILFMELLTKLVAIEIVARR